MTRIERNLTALAIGILLGMWMGASYATGGHIIKPPIVTPPAVPPVTPTPPIATTPPSSPPAPSQQPSAGNGAHWSGWLVMGLVAAYFAETIRQHYLWCLEDDRKQERRCYRPLRDGMPR